MSRHKDGRSVHDQVEQSQSLNGQMHLTPLITIFTPTFNRAHTLNRVFDSLQAQTCNDFEWLVIDDGSTDGTTELITAWAKAAHFPIRYLRQKHSGKHIAYNRALRECRGRFFAVLDSDDAIVARALERCLTHWNSIPAHEQVKFYAVIGLSCDPHGHIVGDQFPASPFDTNQRELRYVHRIHGEKFGLLRTDILRRYPFPELPGTQFIPEGAVWLEIAKTYKQRAVNEVFRIYHCDKGEISLSSRKNLAQTARGRLHYYLWLLNNDFEYIVRTPTPFLKAALMLPIASIYAQTSWWHSWKTLQLRSARWLVLSVLPASLLVYLWFRARTSKPVAEMAITSDSR